MTLTSSTTVLQNYNRWDNQRTSTCQEEIFTAHPSDYLKSQWYYFQIVSQLINCTNDGGVILDRGCFMIWDICINLDNTNRTLLRIKSNNEILAQSPCHSLLSSQEKISHQLPSHLVAIQWIERATGLSQDRIGRLIGVTRQTINGWKKGGKIADDNRQRLFAVREVLERAASKYSTQDELVAWLDTPRGAEGRTPAQLLENKEIDRARLLAITTPSPHLLRAQPWAKKPIPEAFLLEEEHYPEALPPEQDDEFNLLNDDLDNDGIIVLDDGTAED